MKTRYTILILCFSIQLPNMLYGQLNMKHNGFRSGDVIIKQQIEKQQAGSAGSDIVWDFSQIELINDDYELSYQQLELEGDSLYFLGENKLSKQDMKKFDCIVGTEHQTLYYYLQSQDSVFLLGHENVAGKLEYLQPLTIHKFPSYYGYKTTSVYQTSGLYSGVEAFTTEGILEQGIDAYGSIIMPGGKTLSPVVRQKTRQLIRDTTQDIIKENDNDLGQELVTYKWYTKGYRYPIFEVVECNEIATKQELFSTSFYYPLQDHLYLETDSANLALLDNLWDYTDNDGFPTQNIKGINYTMYPNPVENMLNVEYYLEKESSVIIMVSTLTGAVTRTISKGKQPKGKYKENISFAGFTSGIYLVRIIASDFVVTEKIMKK